jgi:hypothetical protein
MSIQIADSVVIAMELVVLGIIAIWCVVMRNRITFETSQVADEKFFYSLSRSATIESAISRSPTVERPLPLPPVPQLPVSVTSVPVIQPPQARRYTRRNWTEETPARHSGAATLSSKNSVNRN